MKVSVDEVLNNIEEGEKFFVRNIVVTPLYQNNKDTVDEQEYLSLDEALNNNKFKINEINNVNEVEIQNELPDNVCILDGEHIAQGYQNRMFLNSVVVLSGERIKENVYCIEAGRWNGNTRTFLSTGDMSYPKLRLISLYHTRTGKKIPQSQIWDEIENKFNTLSYHSKTSSLTDLNRYMDNLINDYVENYEYNGEIGYKVKYQNSLLSVEILNNQNLMKKLCKKLLKSYLYDALTLENEKILSIRNFSKEMKNIKIKPRKRTRGEEYRIFTEKLEGKIYSFREKLIHLTIFNRRKIAA